MPLTSSFSTNKETVLVCSHPGWSRRYEHEQEVISHTIQTSPIIATLRERSVIGNEAFETLYAPKVAALLTGYSRLLYEEACSEEALSRALKKEMPAVVTVPAIEQNGRLVVAEGNVPYLSSYLKALFSEFNASYPHSEIWLLPTGHTCGTIIGAPYAHDDPQGEKTFVSLQNPAVGRFINPVLSSGARQILFAGGYLDGCLLSTITYFLPHDCETLIDIYKALMQRDLAIDDRFTVSQFQFELDPSGNKFKEQSKGNFALGTAQLKEIFLLLKDAITGKKEPSYVRSKIIERFIFNFGRATTNNWTHFCGWEDHIIMTHNCGLSPESLKMLPSVVKPDGILLGQLIDE